MRGHRGKRHQCRFLRKPIPRETRNAVEVCVLGTEKMRGLALTQKEEQFPELSSRATGLSNMGQSNFEERSCPS